MRPEIDHVLERCGGVASRTQLLTAVTRHQLDFEIRRGRLTAAFRGAWARPWDADVLLDRAALVSVGSPSVLSHLSALQRWQLRDAVPAVVHVSIPDSRCVRPQPGLVVHRLARSPLHVGVDGLRVAHPAEAVVTSWPLLDRDDARAVVIGAVRNRVVSVAELAARLETHPTLAGRRDLGQLLHLLDAGCESELEIWGLVHVFDAPGLRHGRRQLGVSTAAGRFRLDLGYDEERVGVELDGHAYHSSREQRERDMRRDAALAASGWLVLRFSRRRLVDDPEGCRRDTLRTLAARRAEARAQ